MPGRGPSFWSHSHAASRSFFPRRKAKNLDSIFSLTTLSKPLFLSAHVSLSGTQRGGAAAHTALGSAGRDCDARSLHRSWRLPAGPLCLGRIYLRRIFVDCRNSSSAPQSRKRVNTRNHELASALLFAWS